MAKTSAIEAHASNPSEANLSRILKHLESAILSPNNPELLRNPYERNKVASNFEYARSLLLRLEHESTTIKVASRKQTIQADLQTKRELIKRLQIRLQELNNLEEDSSSDEEDTPSYAPASQASNGLDREPSSAQDAAENLSSTLRSRNPQGSTSKETSATTTQSSRYGNTSTADNTASQNKESLLTAQRFEQESIKDSLTTLAQNLKLSAQNFSVSLEADKDVVDSAVSGLDRNVDGMEQTGGRMGTLRRMTEGKGWWDRMILYGWIAALWVLAILIMFVMPKLRF